MFNKDHLIQGLEWVSKKTRIYVYLHSHFLDVYLYPDYPSKGQCIRLLMDIMGNDSVRITDLVGNQYPSAYQNAGYGTLAFNVGLQALRAYFNGNGNAVDESKIVVHGSISSVGDPDDGPAKEECRDRRNQYWRKFGFKLSDPAAYNTRMEARLSDLREKKSGSTEYGTPRWISLERFWVKDCAPIMSAEDIESLLAIDLSQHQLERAPSEHDIKVALQDALRWSTFLRNFLWVVLILLGVYMAIKFEDHLNILLSLPVVFFASYFLILYASDYVFQRMPPYRKHNRLRVKKRMVYSSLCQQLQSLEQDHNGYFWRIYAAITKIDNDSKSARFDELARLSKEQALFYTLEKNENCRDYYNFVIMAKEIVGKRNDLECLTTQQRPHALEVQIA